MNEEENKKILDAVNTASMKWKNAFNFGDSIGCAAQYEKEAVMNAKPFGTYTGTAEIEAFWQKLINDGFSDVDYIDPIIKIIDKKTVLLTAGWKMNNAHGIITKELWIIQPDGTAKLREDDFEVQG